MKTEYGNGNLNDNFFVLSQLFNRLKFNFRH